MKFLKIILIVAGFFLLVQTSNVGSAIAGTPNIYRYFPSSSSYSTQVNNSINFSVGCDDSEGLKRVDWYVNSSFDHSTSISGYYDEATWSKQFTSAGTYNIGAVAVDTDSNTDEIAWVITVKAGHPSQEFFDDFHYSSVDDSLFLSFGWEVQDIENIWGPGIDGTWRKAAVTFVPSSQAPYDYAL